MEPTSSHRRARAKLQWEQSRIPTGQSPPTVSEDDNEQDESGTKDQDSPFEEAAEAQEDDLENSGQLGIETRNAGHPIFSLLSPPTPTDPPPPFEPKADDVHERPQKGQLISYLFHEEDRMYRVGVLCSGDGKILFYNEDEPTKPLSKKFYLNMKFFKTGHFRIRHDLAIGTLCWDWEHYIPWKLLEINNSNGAVRVQCPENISNELWISPDHLVGGYTPQVVNHETLNPPPKQDVDGEHNTEINYSDSERRTGTEGDETDLVDLTSSKKRCWEENSSFGEDTVVIEEEESAKKSDGVSADDKDAKKRPRVQTSCTERSHESQIDNKPTQNAPSEQKKNRTYTGVYVGETTEVDSKTGTDCKWYIRGRIDPPADDNDGLDPDSNIPRLLQGEIVKYCPETMKTVYLEVVEWSNRELDWKKVRGKQFKEFQKTALRAEILETRQIKKDMADGRQNGRFSVWRPEQPVYVLNKGKATIKEGPDKFGTVKVHFDGEPDDKKLVTEKVTSLCLFDPDVPAYDRDAFLETKDVPAKSEKPSYRMEPDYLYKQWKEAGNEGDESKKFEQDFEKLVNLRKQIRSLATGLADGSILTMEGERRLNERWQVLLKRLQFDFEQPQELTMMHFSDFKPRISEIKNISTQPNLMLLCGGFAPEVTAYKRLGAAPLGTVIIQDTDLHAVGVAVAAHPDVDFAIIVGKPGSQYAPGDIRILRNKAVVRLIEVLLGGVHGLNITNPCQPFSLAGNKEGFISENGQLLHDCLTVLRHLIDAPLFLAENVPSTIETNESFDDYVGAKYLKVCGSMCSPSIRTRRFATNRPPPICSETPGPGKPPSLNGDLPELLASAVVAEKGRKKGKRFVHPKLKKFPCLMNSNPDRHKLVFEECKERYREPIQTQMTPMEAERAMGYREDELGVTAFSVEKYVRKRIQEHNYEIDGPLVWLKGRAAKKDQLEKVDDARRLKLLGNSQIVTLLTAFLWRERELFPAVTSNDS